VVTFLPLERRIRHLLPCLCKGPILLHDVRALVGRTSNKAEHSIA
jgi:hypothetical protein